MSSVRKKVAQVCTPALLLVACGLCIRGQEPEHVKAPPFPPPADVEKPPAGARKQESGISYVVLAPGPGSEAVLPNDCVTLRFTAWHSDGSLFSTSGNRGQTVMQCMPATIPGIADALRFMTAGARWRVWIPASLSYLPSKEQGKAPEHRAITVDLELVTILKAPVTPANLITPPASATRLPSSVHIEVLKPGNGLRHPSLTSRVTVHYTGWTQQGRMFETTVMSGHPASILVGSALPGWRDSLRAMTAGEKARLWVPSALAFGDHPTEKGLPAGNLVYDIELIEIK